MRGCFAAILVIVGLFLVLIVGAFLTAVVRPVARRAVVVQYQGDGRPRQVLEAERAERPDGSTYEPIPTRQIRSNPVINHSSYRVTQRGARLIVIMAFLALIPLFVVLVMACRGSGARVRCERSRSVEQMRTLEELRAGIEKMAGRVESLETILCARPGRQ